MGGGRFEWLVAWRYLRDPDRRASAAFYIGLALVAVGVGLAWLGHGLPKPENMEPGVPIPAALKYGRWVFVGGVVLAVVGAWVAIFGACLSAFRLFTTISIFGVFFGTQALIFVLSVMSGFEGNLRRSILGNNAHVVIRKGHKPFKRDLALERKLFDEKGTPRIKDLTAVTPFLKDEVILSGPKAHSGVYLKGIDPRNPFSRQLVGNNIRIGTIDNLLHPARMAYLAPATLPIPVDRGGDDSAGFGPDPTDPDKLGPATPDRPRAPRPASPTKIDTTAPRPATPAKIDTAAPRPGPAPPRTRPSAPTSAPRPDARRPPSTPPGTPAVKTPATPDPHPNIAHPSRPRILPGIIIGRELAKTLGLRLGDRVDVISTKTQDIIVTGPMPRLKEFRVAGVFFSGHYEYDQKYAYVSLPVAQEFLRKEGRISGLELRTSTPDAAQRVARRIRTMLGERSGYEVRPWQQIHKAIFSALQAEKIAMFVVLVIIVIVAAFSIVANLIMVVAEKSGEIAVLRSMGAKAKNVLFIFLFDGLYIGLIGMITGISMGVVLSLLVRHFGVALDPEVYYIQAIPVAINPVEVVVVACSVIGISLLAALFPAIRAMGLRPVQGLRFK